MATILDAITNLVQNTIIDLKDVYESRNRANNMGDALEEYIKDLFADSFQLSNTVNRNQRLSEVFSYLGNQNNPPDAILKNHDAIEVKKIESPKSSLALNSSYPKSKLLANSSMISKACRECEPNWNNKDIIYIVGVVAGKKLDSLAFVYGEDYAADKEIYERIRSTIKEGVDSIPGVDFSPTKELGRINKVDPLGITYLRVRGMWGIENPFQVFNYVYQKDSTRKFNFMCIINDEKWNSLPEEQKNALMSLSKTNSNLIIANIQIRNPNNPANLRNAKLIKYFI